MRSIARYIRSIDDIFSKNDAIIARLHQGRRLHFRYSGIISGGFFSEFLVSSLVTGAFILTGYAVNIELVSPYKMICYSRELAIQIQRLYDDLIAAYFASPALLHFGYFYMAQRKT